MPQFRKKAKNNKKQQVKKKTELIVTWIIVSNVTIWIYPTRVI